jgi:tRNA U34 2-thiouridine synthase MnmA/TrmU
LLSGGLDSTLAVKLMIDQGIEVHVLNLVTPFCTCTRKGCKHEASRVAKLFNVPVKIISAGKEYIEMIKNPKHGYGKNMNPCIDCRIFLFQKAKKYMEEIGARFIITGEVLGQRPMSQHKKALNIIEKESETEGLVVRPLSAKFFPPTIPEEKKWIDREKLLSIKGRRRISQMELAKEFGINDYPCPAGGCRLTDPQFAKRLKEAFAYGECSIKEIQLLKYGRHFRLESGAKVIVGRNEEENRVLLRFFDKDDILMEVLEVGSPIVLLRKYKTKADVKKAEVLCVRYSDADKGENMSIKIRHSSDREKIVELFSL